jgi:hypothetical protein
MSTYTIIPHGGDSTQFDVVITNGSQHVMLGFETEADAEAWIANAERFEPSEHDDDGYSLPLPPVDKP